MQITIICPPKSIKLIFTIYIKLSVILCFFKCDQHALFAWLLNKSQQYSHDPSATNRKTKTNLKFTRRANLSICTDRIGDSSILQVRTKPEPSCPFPAPRLPSGTTRDRPQRRWLYTIARRIYIHIFFFLVYCMPAQSKPFMPGNELFSNA